MDNVVFRWNNGSVYGPDDLFYYSTGDKYTGQWENNIQHGEFLFYVRSITWTLFWYIFLRYKTFNFLS